MLRLFVSVLFLLAAVSVCCGAVERDRTLRFIDGLLQRGLFVSAIRFCETESKKANDNPEQALFYVSEKIRVLNRLALTRPKLQREPILRQIEELEKQWKPETDRLSATGSFEAFQFSYQLALSDLEVGEITRLEEKTGASNEENRSGFYLERAKERLGNLFKTVSERIADPSIPRSKIDALVAIRLQIEFQTAKIWRTLGSGFERETPEQLDCLQNALRGFSQLAVLEGNDPILLQSRLEKIACLRQMHDLDAAGESLDRFLQRKDELSENDLIQATAEGIRLHLARGDISQAVQWSDVEPQDQSSPRRPDFDLARLEAYLSRWKHADRAGDKQAKELLNHALEFAGRMESRDGPYWGRRAQMLVAESTKNETSGGFGVYVQLAEDAFRREQFSDALRYYDLASDAAEQADDSATAFRCALAAAAIESRLAGSENDDADDRDRAAQKRFCDAAKKWPDLDKAADAYLFGLNHAQKSVDAKKMSVGDFIVLLVDFTNLWPQSPRRDEIARKAAALLESEGRFDEAFAVSPEFEGRTKKRTALQNLVEQGQKEEAIRQGQTLWEQNSDDPAITEIYGDLLAESESREQRQAALDFWRAVEKRLEQPGGPPKTEPENDLYWKAKEMIVRLHLKLGNTDQAQKLIDLIRLLHPEQSSRFEGLGK